MFLLTGEAGSGKSVFVASLACELALSSLQHQENEDGGVEAPAAPAAPGAQRGGGGGGGGYGQLLPVMIDAREAEGSQGIPLDGVVQHYLTTQLG